MATAENALAAKPAELIKIVDGQIVEGNEFAIALRDLKQAAFEVPKVEDSTAAQEAREIVVRGERIVSAIMLAAEPERVRLNNALADLRKQRDTLIAQFVSVTDPLDRAVRDWNIAEADRIAKAEAKINKGRRPEHREHLVRSAPKVPGSRLQVRYDFEVIHEEEIKREFMKADDVKIREKIREGVRRKLSLDVIAKRIGGIKVTRS